MPFLRCNKRLDAFLQEEELLVLLTLTDLPVAPLPAVRLLLLLPAAHTQAGTELDAIGGYCCYGIAEDALVTRQQGLLPLGLAQVRAVSIC